MNVDLEEIGLVDLLRPDGDRLQPPGPTYNALPILTSLLRHRSLDSRLHRD